MKKTAVILSAFVGGAAVGAAAALMCAPKSGVDLQRDAKSLLFEHLAHINEHIKKCRCMMGMGCDCNKDAESAQQEASNASNQ
ncbi:MAG: hypothetical protein R3Y68_06410 [Rikenellaceae bacterium]